MGERVRPVVALDLDGTLVDYHRHFTDFAVQYFDLDMEHFAFEQYDARMPFHKFLGISKVSYRKCKMAYRRGELKRSVPLLPAPLPQAGELTAKLRRWGVEIWLCTTRPYLSYSEVDDATRHNLRRHAVQYQGIMWGEHKYRELVRLVGAERIAAVLDDLPAMCQQAHSLGLPTGFALRPHNRRQYGTLAVGGQWGPWPAPETHVETLDWLREQLDKWKAAR